MAMNKVKKILVGIDFSPASIHALDYAYHLASEIDASIKIIHVYGRSFKPNQYFSYNPYDNRHTAIEQELTKIIDQLPINTSNVVIRNIHVEHVAAHGFVLPQIIKAAQSEETDLLVIGLKEKDSAKENRIGSTTISIAQKAPCPVLLVPDKLSYVSFQHILFANDPSIINSKSINEIALFAKLFNATLHFVHVENTRSENLDKVDTFITNFLKEYSTSTLPHQFATLPAGPVSYSLLTYAKENKIDLVVLVNETERFLDNLFGRSTTQEISSITSLPVLVLQK